MKPHVLLRVGQSKKAGTAVVHIFIRQETSLRRRVRARVRTRVRVRARVVVTLIRGTWYLQKYHAGIHTRTHHDIPSRRRHGAGHITPGPGTTACHCALVSLYSNGIDYSYTYSREGDSLVQLDKAIPSLKRPAILLMLTSGSGARRLWSRWRSLS